MNWMKYSKGLMVACAVVLASCYPEGAEFYEDTDVVFTNYEPAYDFKSKGTFAMPDQIVLITGNSIGPDDDPEYMKPAVSGPLLTMIRENMVAAGYTEVDISADPDLILAPAAMESTTIVYWYDYWGWWWGGYYPGWGYPYYPYYPSYTSYSTGTLLMMIIDPTIETPTGRPIAQWTGAIAGMLSYSYNAARANRLIDQAFAQSPYLKAN
jgi:hypothetical protein